MIISIRGTSGSGKSTLVRKLMHNPQPLVENKELVGHQCEGFRVVGPYPTDRKLSAVGVDVLGRNSRTRDVLFDQILRWAMLGNVVYEGLLVSNEVGRTVSQAELKPTRIIFLDTPLDVCLERVNARRREKAGSSLFGTSVQDVSPVKTTEKFKELTRVAKRLTEHGLSVEWLPCDAAFERCQELLK